MIDATVKVGVVMFRKDRWASVRARIEELHDQGESDFEQGQTVAVVGDFDHIAPGTLLRVFGDLSEYRGQPQIKSRSSTVVVGPGVEDLRAFAGIVFGVGVAIKMFAGVTRDDAAEAMHTAAPDSPWGLLKRAIDHNDKTAEAMRWLLTLDIPDDTRARLIREFEHRTKDILEANPYALVEEGWAFTDVDELALGALDLDPKDPRRFEAAVNAAIMDEEDEGHTWAPIDRLHLSRAIAGRFEQDQLTKAAVESGMLAPPSIRVQRKVISYSEHSIADRILTILNTPKAPIDETALTLDPKLSEEQREAVRQAASQGVLLLIGGAGVGKSHTTKQIVDSLAGLGAVVLAAPTGKAARRLAQATGRQASTIHRALGPVPDGLGWAFNRERPWPVATVVLDEVSMIDVELFAAALEAVPDNARLILVGDDGQLPSVRPGAVLRDLKASGKIPSVTLTKIFRNAEDSSIPHAARAIQEGSVPKIGGRLSAPDLVFAAKESDELLEFVVDLAAHRLRKPGKNRRAFKASEIYVVTPQVKGPLGTRAINVAMQAEVNPGHGGIWIRSQTTARAGDRVIHVENDYDQEVFNGESGYVQEVDEEQGVMVDSILPDEKGQRTKTRDKTRVLSVAYEQPDGSFRTVGYTRAGAKRYLELAYAITVHKSQGSTLPAVVYVTARDHAFMLTRQLLYTGLTRGGEFVALVGHGEAIKKAVGNTRGEKRRTTLYKRLEAWTPKPKEETKDGLRELVRLTEEAGGYAAEAKQLEFPPF